MRKTSHPPVVLLIGGNDPSGGAGLVADIQAVTAAGAHPAPVVAALTVQDSSDVTDVEALDPSKVVAQAEAVLADLPVAAVKLGLLASAAVGRAVSELLKKYPPRPVVVDPVLAAGGGAPLAEDALLDVYLQELFPLATLVTPNAGESRRFAPQAEDAAGRAHVILRAGARHVLIKGADETGADVHHHLYGPKRAHREYIWPRLPGGYHGSGCTLASAVAARLARGQALEAAVGSAQRYTWEALRDGWQLGRGQRFPKRGL